MNQKRVRETLVQLALQPSKLAKTLSRRMPGATCQALTIVALDGQWLKLLQMEGPARARKVTKVLACPVQGESSEEIQLRLKKACAAEALAPKDVLLANPTHLSTVRIFSLPSTDPKEIRDIVELQAEKHTPYAKNEILTDFKILERERPGYSRVLLVIAHQDVIQRVVRLSETSGWTLERVGSELEGLVSWFQAVNTNSVAPAGAGAQGGPGKLATGMSLVVDVDGSATTLLAIHRGQLQFQRSLPTGLAQLQDDAVHAG